MPSITKSTPFFFIDVESIGLYGDAYAVAGAIFQNGDIIPQTEFVLAIPMECASGTVADRRWVMTNCPRIQPTHETAEAMMAEFWKRWLEAKAQYPNLLMAGDVIHPVESKFLTDCIRATGVDPFSGPYPLVDIASLILACGGDPLKRHARGPMELPEHSPMADVRHSATRLWAALSLFNLPVC